MHELRHDPPRRDKVLLKVLPRSDVVFIGKLPAAVRTLVLGKVLNFIEVVRLRTGRSFVSALATRLFLPAFYVRLDERRQFRRHGRPKKRRSLFEQIVNNPLQLSDTRFKFLVRRSHQTSVPYRLFY